MAFPTESNFEIDAIHLNLRQNEFYIKILSDFAAFFLGSGKKRFCVSERQRVVLLLVPRPRDVVFGAKEEKWMKLSRMLIHVN